MTSFDGESLSAVLPEIFLAVAAMILLMAGAFMGPGRSSRLLCHAATGAFGVTALLILGMGWEERTVLSGMFSVDSFACFMKIMVMSGMMAAMMLSVQYLEREKINHPEYPVLAMFAALGMMMMISAGSLLAMYVGLELQSLSLYVLAAIRRNDLKSSEAGMKYFVLGALASGMMLFGISLVYGYTGALDFAEIAQAASAPGLIVGLAFLLCGMAFKISAVPFHMWTPDVYEGAPTSVTALFAIVPKVAAVALLMRLLYGPFAGVAAEWSQIVWFLSAASMILGAFAAIGQTNIKRLMAYSSIGNMGYALMGVAAGGADGAGAVVVYLMIYMIMSAGVFGVILSMRRGGRYYEGIGDLAGLSRVNPKRAWALAFLMFSMSGIPPMAGFFGKLMVFQAAVQTGYIWLAVIGVLTSVVAAYYYIRIIKVMFFEEPLERFDRDLGFGLRTVVFLSSLFTLFFILSPDMLVEAGRSAAAVLFTG